MNLTISNIQRVYKKIYAMQSMFRSIPIKLTEEEKYSIAVMSGIRTHIETKKDGTTYSVTEKCGVCWTGDEFLLIRDRI